MEYIPVLKEKRIEEVPRSYLFNVSNTLNYKLLFQIIYQVDRSLYERLDDELRKMIKLRNSKYSFKSSSKKNSLVNKKVNKVNGVNKAKCVIKEVKNVKEDKDDILINSLKEAGVVKNAQALKDYRVVKDARVNSIKIINDDIIDINKMDIDNDECDDSKQEIFSIEI